MYGVSDCGAARTHMGGSSSRSRRGSRERVAVGFDEHMRAAFDALPVFDELPLELDPDLQCLYANLEGKRDANYSELYSRRQEPTYAALPEDALFETSSLSSYEPQRAGHLSFRSGQKLQILNCSKHPWWEARDPVTGSIGFVPANFTWRAKMWKKISSAPLPSYFHGMMDSATAGRMLVDQDVGAFLVRLSGQEKGGFTLSIVRENMSIGHVRFFEPEGGGFNYAHRQPGYVTPWENVVAKIGVAQGDKRQGSSSTFCLRYGVARKTPLKMRDQEKAHKYIAEHFFRQDLDNDLPPELPAPREAKD